MSNIYKIKDKQLDDFISFNDTNKIILFYKQNCMFCKGEIADLDKLANIYKDNIDYAICDITNARKFCINNNLFSFPTIQIYKNKEVIKQIVARKPIEELEKEIKSAYSLT